MLQTKLTETVKKLAETERKLEETERKLAETQVSLSDTVKTFPSSHVVKKRLSGNTRIIINATEFFIERPSSLLSQSATFSSYKNKNTVKVLLQVGPYCLYQMHMRDPYLTGN